MLPKRSLFARLTQDTFPRVYRNGKFQLVRIPRQDFIHFIYPNRVINERTTIASIRASRRELNDEIDILISRRSRTICRPRGSRDRDRKC